MKQLYLVVTYYGPNMVPKEVGIPLKARDSLTICGGDKSLEDIFEYSPKGTKLYIHEPGQRTVSREHGVVSVSQVEGNRQVHYEAKQSTNGSYKNRNPKAVLGQTTFEAGDHFRLGPYVYLKLEEKEESPETTPEKEIQKPTPIAIKPQASAKKIIITSGGRKIPSPKK